MSVDQNIIFLFFSNLPDSTSHGGRCCLHRAEVGHSPRRGDCGGRLGRRQRATTRGVSSWRPTLVLLSLDGFHGCDGEEAARLSCPPSSTPVASPYLFDIITVSVVLYKFGQT